jgi:hypothetical protein
MGEAYYTEIKKKLVDWYCVMNHLCSLGEVEKMYIPPAMDLSLGIIENQNQKVGERPLPRTQQESIGYKDAEEDESPCT